MIAPGRSPFDAEIGAPLPRRHYVKLAIVIPCYRVKAHIIGVIEGVLDYADAVYVVDDCCPEGTADFVEARFQDPKLCVIRHARNLGVGGAVVSGYRQALRDGCDIVVKMDGDGQMDPLLMPALIEPIVARQADYTKGNRFFEINDLRAMPALRIFGNSVLSFVNKLTTGYWDVMDPTNGYTAIHRRALEHLTLDRLEQRYFFESDMLFRLAIIRAVVQDVPMRSIYGNELSNLRVGRIALTFPHKYLVRLLKRFFYLYLLRDFNVGTIETLGGVAALLFGAVYGLTNWYEFSNAGIAAPAGVVMFSALPVILGFQLLLSALAFDIANRPRFPLQNVVTAHTARSALSQASPNTSENALPLEDARRD